MFDYAYNFKNTIAIFTIISSVVVIIAILYATVAIYKVKQANVQQLAILFSLTNDQLNNLCEKIKKYITFLKFQVEITNNDESSAGEFEQPTNVNQTNLLSHHLSGKRRMQLKEYSNNNGTLILNIICFYIIYLVFEGFYVLYYYKNNVWLNNFLNFKVEYNKTGQITMYHIVSVTKLQYFFLDIIDVL